MSGHATERQSKVLRGIPRDESLFAKCAKRDRARVRLASRPAAFRRMAQNGGANRAAEMVLAFAPVDAGAAQWAPPALEGLERETALDQEVTPLLSQMDERAAPA
jgi:hypothetical protein